ncbi:unnamed protein product [Rotaria sordida]|uniref:Uncharacterized protein n=1 Tax=Rotaria sordida TaxID=392033 RepID=A0A818PJT5_9BILA|nr:unnamed protein product [Rotaria sordida]CAF3624577.1 unnamed protein product [Rotaria sordida]
MLTDINEWGDTLIHNICQHVNKQIDRITQEYDNEMRYLKQRYQLFIDELYIHEQTNTTEQVNQLLDRCKALKFELAALEYTQQPIQLIQVTQQESVNINLNELNTIDTKNDKFDKKLIVIDDKEKDRSTYAGVSIKSTSTNSKQTNRRLLSIEISNDDDRSINNCDNMLDECSKCFMVFPSNMASADRTAHINGHTIND